MINIKLNGESHQVSPSLTIHQLIESYKLNPAVIVVEHNGEILQRSSYNSAEVRDGDAIELVHFVGGG